MKSNPDRRETDYVQITPLTFTCKTKNCEGKASYTFHPIQVVYKFRLGSGNHQKVPREVPRILGKLTRAIAKCKEEHETPCRVAFFKCSERGCTEYVMGTIEKDCKDRDRIFNDKDEANLTCINNHTCPYHL